MKTSCSLRVRGHLSARTFHISTFVILSSLLTVAPAVAGIPADAVPVDVTGRLSILHADDFEHGKSTYFTYLEDAAKKTKFNLRFEGICRQA